MKLLIDTQCWLWWLGAPDRLSDHARSLIADSANEIFLSAVSAWEIAIKAALGKLDLPIPPERYVPSRLAEQAMKSLPIEQSHALHVYSLPPHHRDPFDRMLVAQAQLESLRLLTADRALEAYEVEIIWAGASSR
jgi:PIN domain nuclease of toxin-antitoxin system